LRSAYAVSKAGLIALTRTLAAEVGPYNIRVNAIAPGPVSGNRMKRVIEERARGTGQSIAEIEASYLHALVLGRMVEEEDVARMALFLASKEGDNITGQVFNVCSGYKIE
jgi:NAD(P)-dependent dehydrogenase (short-subunit alcohol dehydrogenase family)